MVLKPATEIPENNIFVCNANAHRECKFENSSWSHYVIVKTTPYAPSGVLVPLDCLLISSSNNLWQNGLRFRIEGP